MATSQSIPPFIPMVAGDLIKSADFNDVQRGARDSIRRHKHTRVSGAAYDESTTQDVAEQIGTTEIANSAVTTDKVKNASITLEKLKVFETEEKTKNLANTATTGDALIAEDVSMYHVFFPSVTVTSETGEVSVAVVYKKVEGKTNAYLRFSGSGTVKWKVRYFAPELIYTGLFYAHEPVLSILNP